MSKATSSFGQGAATTGQMPSILTNSALAMVEFYGNSIVELEARGSRGNTERYPIIEDLGFEGGDTNESWIEIDYIQSRNSRGEPTNGLGDMQSAFETELKAQYGKVVEDDDGFLDASVQSMTVEIQSPGLQAYENRDTDVFDFVFESVKADDSEKTVELNEAEGLCRSGWTPRDLDLVAVYETQEVHGPRRAEPFIERANDEAIPDCDDTVAERIKESFLPDPFAKKKRYFRVKEDKILVV